MAFAACLGVPLDVAKAALQAAGQAAARINRPLPDPHAPTAPATAAGAGGGGAGGREEGPAGGQLELRAWMLAGGPSVGVSWDVVEGLPTLYDQPYSHKTDAAALRAAAAAAGCTHVVVGAARAGEDRAALKVAAVGEVGAALGGTEGDETRVSHGAHWYCREERGFGFAPNDDVERGNAEADGNHRYDPLRLSWRINGGSGWRAGDVCYLRDSSEWRKLVWGLRL